MKKIIAILLTMLIAFSAVACNAGSDRDIESTNNSQESTENTQSSTVPEEEKLFAIETEYGAIMYPQNWQERLEVSIDKEDEDLTATFTTVIDYEVYYLFKVTISSDDGDVVGRITDSSGTTRNVFIYVYDLGDISELSAEKQDILYAMQEGINVVIENLETL